MKKKSVTFRDHNDVNLFGEDTRRNVELNKSDQVVEQEEEKEITIDVATTRRTSRKQETDQEIDEK